MRNTDSTILIVDDTPANLQMLGNFLLQNNYKIEYAVNGAAALEWVKEKEFDLILLDIAMPEIDGFEVCKRLKANVKTKDIPVIFLTAKIETNNIVKGFDLGAADYVVKPFNQKELLARIDCHLELSHAKKIIEQQNNQLKVLNQSKDKFFSIIAHDLRNPFSALLGLLKLLKDKHRKVTAEWMDNSISALYDASKNCYNLLENLLLWSRSQTDRIAFSPVKINLREVIDESIALHNIAIENKKIEILAPALDNIYVMADFNMVNTIARNLISNAVKFTPNNGKINIDIKKEKKLVVTSVADNGMGIKKDLQKKIFEIGNSVTTQGSEKETGTGLGLIICKEFVEKNGGKIWFESTWKKGSKFMFSLPVQN